MASNEEKKQDEVVERGEELSKLLLKMYRFAYDSLSKDCDVEKLKQKYSDIVENISEKTGISDSFASPKNIIGAIEKLIVSAENKYIYQQRDAKIEAEKEAKVKLVKYCEKDNIDQALITLLKYKLEHPSCKEIVNYIHSSSGGWSSYSYAAIHKLLGQVNRKKYSYQNEKELEQRDEYIRNIIDSKYDKTIFLVEIMLKEGLSTTIKSSASGWRVRATNETVFDQALSSDNNDVLRLIFKYGVDIDIESMCHSGGSSMRTDSSSSWKPIHTAIEKRNHELTKLIIARGADINSYRTHRMCVCSPMSYCTHTIVFFQAK